MGDMITLFPFRIMAFRYNPISRCLAFGVQKKEFYLKYSLGDEFRYNLLLRIDIIFSLV